MKTKRITQDKVVYFINYVLLGLLLLTILYPLIYVVSASFSSGDALASGKVRLFPVEPTLLSYKTVFEYDAIWTGFVNSIIYTTVDTFGGVSAVQRRFSGKENSFWYVPVHDDVFRRSDPILYVD